MTKDQFKLAARAVAGGRLYRQFVYMYNDSSKRRD